MINNKLSWKNYLYGDQENTGLSKEKLQCFSSCIFYSKLNYFLAVFGNIFSPDTYKEENRRYFSFTTKDNNNLQVLQNKLNKLLLEADYNTPTADLLKQTSTLSVHQMVAYQTAVSTYKIVKTGKPTFIAEKIKIRQSDRNTRLGWVQSCNQTTH